MLELITDFVAALRRAGLPVSPHESIDATTAVAAVGLARQHEVRAALRATLVKSVAHEQVFEELFELYFGPRAAGAQFDAGAGADVATGGEVPPGGRREDRGDLAQEAPGGRGGGHAGGDDPPPTAEELVQLLLAALASGDPAAIRRAARLAVSRYAGIDASRPVGASYYVARTLRAIDEGALLARLIDSLRAGGTWPEDDGSPGGPHALAALADRLGPLGEQLLTAELRARLEQLEAAVQSEVRAALAGARGLDAVVASLRRPLVEDVDFMHATAGDLQAMRRALQPLTRALASRLARKRRHHRAGPLDFRATVRRSLSTGGVPLELVYRPPHVTKPELFVLADVSGSVASFARFTLMLLSAIAEQFASVRSFLFIDGVDEVSGALRRGSTSPDALRRALEAADVVASDGHSDYGRALRAFEERYGSEVSPRATMLVLGDARNNYHAASAEILETLARRARRLYWLNPEPRGYWGSGDSIIDVYAPHCDAVFECRNLRQLEAFVAELA